MRYFLTRLMLLSIRFLLCVSFHLTDSFTQFLCELLPQKAVLNSIKEHFLTWTTIFLLFTFRKMLIRNFLSFLQINKSGFCAHLIFKTGFEFNFFKIMPTIRPMATKSEPSIETVSKTLLTFIYLVLFRSSKSNELKSNLSIL